MVDSSPLPPIQDLQKIAPLVDTYCPLCEVCIGDAQVEIETAKTEYEASAQDVAKLVRDSMGPYRMCCRSTCLGRCRQFTANVAKAAKGGADSLEDAVDTSSMVPVPSDPLLKAWIKEFKDQMFQSSFQSMQNLLGNEEIELTFKHADNSTGRCWIQCRDFSRPLAVTNLDGTKSIKRFIYGDIKVEDAASGSCTIVKGLPISSLLAQCEEGFYYSKGKTLAPSMKVGILPNHDVVSKISDEEVIISHLSQCVTTGLPKPKVQHVKYLKIEMKYKNPSNKEGDEEINLRHKQMKTPLATVSLSQADGKVSVPVMLWLHHLAQQISPEDTAQIIGPGATADRWATWMVAIMQAEIKAKLPHEADEVLLQRVEFFIRRNQEALEQVDTESLPEDLADRCYPRYNHPLNKMRALLRSLAAGFTCYLGLSPSDQPTESQTVRGPFNAQISELIVSLRQSYGTFKVDPDAAGVSYRDPAGEDAEGAVPDLILGARITSASFSSIDDEELLDREKNSTKRSDYCVRLTSSNENCGICGAIPGSANMLTMGGGEDEEAIWFGNCFVPACRRCKFPRPQESTLCTFREIPSTVPLSTYIALKASHTNATKCGSDLESALSIMSPEMREKRKDPNSVTSRALEASSKMTDDPSMCTVADRPISSHSTNALSRLVLACDFGFFDCADDNDSNPSAKGYLAIGAFLSCHVDRSVIDATYQRFLTIAQELNLALLPYDPKLPVPPTRRVLSIDGEPMMTYPVGFTLDVEEAFLRARRLHGYAAAHISVVYTSSRHIDVQTIAERLLRPVRDIFKRCSEREDISWAERWLAGEFDFISQLQQQYMVIKPEQDDPPTVTGPSDSSGHARYKRLASIHRAAEIDVILTRGYRASMTELHNMAARGQYSWRLGETASSGGRSVDSGESKFYLPHASKGLVPVAAFGSVSSTHGGNGYDTEIARLMLRPSGGTDHEDGCDLTVVHRYDPSISTTDKEEKTSVSKSQFILPRSQIEGDYDLSHIPDDRCGDNEMVGIAQPEMAVDTNSILMVIKCKKATKHADEHGQIVVYAPRRGTLIRTVKKWVKQDEFYIKFTIRLDLPEGPGSKEGMYCQKFTLCHAITSIHCSGGASRIKSLHPATLASRSCPSLIASARRTELALALGIDGNHKLFQQKDERTGHHLFFLVVLVVDYCFSFSFHFCYFSFVSDFQSSCPSCPSCPSLFLI